MVIGETTEIGARVKLYHAVTLGARSFQKDQHGKIKKGGKRHPTVQDDVTIYPGSTILGGRNRDRRKIDHRRQRFSRAKRPAGFAGILRRETTAHRTKAKEATRRLRVMNFANKGKRCSRFAVRSAALTCLESERHASHRDAATAPAIMSKIKVKIKRKNS